MGSLEYRLLVFRKFWRAWIPLSIVGLVVIFLALYLLNDFQTKKTDAEIKVSLQQVDNHINEHFRAVFSDLAFLVNNPVTDDFIDYPESLMERVVVESMFESVAQSHEDYDQIRLLSKDGVELVRVDHNDGIVSTASSENLQDKSDRYYFKEGLALKYGAVYISRFDLNIENGEVEVPYKPMMRFVSPIVDDKHDIVAFIVLNLKGDMILTHLHEILRANRGLHSVLNSEGYRLHSQNPQDPVWTFMFDSKDNFASEYPEIWTNISSSDYGVFESDQGRIHHRVVNKEITEGNESLKKGLKPWTLIVITNDGLMSGAFLKEHITYLFPLLIAFPLGSFLLWFWARAAAGRCLAEERLKNINVELEKKVKLRTNELELTREATILSLAILAETRDNETGHHLRRTQRYAKVLASELQAYSDFEDIITDDFINELFRSAPLHDIGKVGIPDQILLKPGKLSEDEFKVMQQHTVLGSNALEEAIHTISEIDSSGGAMTFLHLARDIAHYHHERWDGGGYPNGLSGELIPLGARIIAIVDVYDALVSARVYKEAFSKDKAEWIILNESVGYFDPRIIKAFTSVKDQFWEIRREFSDGEIPSNKGT